MGWTVEQVTVGGERVLDTFTASLTEPDRAKVAALIVMLTERGNTLREPHSKPVDGDIFELRTKTGVRVFYVFRPGRRIVLLGGMVKKRKDIPADVLRTMKTRAKAVS